MQVYEMLSEQQARKVGEQIIEMLCLTKNKDGRYNTSWGSKTVVGLGRCAQRIVVETTKLKE
jgi:hypothetical protein